MAIIRDDGHELRIELEKNENFVVDSNEIIITKKEQTKDEDTHPCKKVVTENES